MKKLLSIFALFLLLFGCLELSVAPASEDEGADQTPQGGPTTTPPVVAERVIPTAPVLENTPFVDEDLPTTALDTFEVH